MENVLVSTLLALSLLLSQPTPIEPMVAGASAELAAVFAEQKREILASESLDLANRYPVASVSEGFRENILVNLKYLEDINGAEPIVLNPGEVFAFHKNILPKFREDKIITQTSEYRPRDGYKLVSGLYGNGVCHLASLMNWVATEAGLEVTALASHDFAAIPGVERKYGTSIKFYPNVGGTSERQNLYIRNNKDYPIELVFSLEGENLNFSVLARR